MRIALGSCFRNNEGPYLTRYFRQVAALVEVLRPAGHTLELVLVWGDCLDRTAAHLANGAEALGLPYNLVERSHGGPVYGSTEALERMVALSYVGNGVFEHVGRDVDALVYVESDLLWRPETFARLLRRLELDAAFDVVSPLIFAGRAFYDIWAFRKSGHRFGPFPPYHGELDLLSGALTEVDSTGSCLVMRADVARKVRIPTAGPGDLALVGFCREARAAGFRIWVDPRERIDHPC